MVMMQGLMVMLMLVVEVEVGVGRRCEDVLTNGAHKGVKKGRASETQGTKQSIICKGGEKIV